MSNFKYNQVYVYKGEGSRPKNMNSKMTRSKVWPRPHTPLPQSPRPHPFPALPLIRSGPNPYLLPLKLPLRFYIHSLDEEGNCFCYPWSRLWVPVLINSGSVNGLITFKITLIHWKTDSKKASWNWRNSYAEGMFFEDAGLLNSWLGIDDKALVMREG